MTHSMFIGNLQLNWLRTFEAAGRHLSFSLAAAELNMSQSAVSQQVKLLEHKLGKSLFKRQTRSIQLTIEGRAYLDVVQEGLQRLSLGMKNIFGSVAEGVLDLSVNNTFAQLWLVPRLGRFMELHPKLSLRMLQTNWDIDYPTSRAELEIRYGSGNWPGFEVRSLLSHQLQPYCCVQFVNTLRTPNDLFGAPLIDVLGTPSGWRDWQHRYTLGQHEPIHRFNVDSYEIAASMAIEGMGICLLPDDLVKGSRLEPHLVCPLNAPIDSSAGYFMARRTDRPLSGPALAFNSWLITESGVVPDI
ncbi:MAG: LysR family transcriptional regulator [Candidimonas sp.]|nr:MAG: LysR family transcriptional regulator [Candidimonas sp.]TAM77322.1 MAG: LysR family transcriptional regulator [Candidimonas sp.]